jgi:hypothetical protein
MGPVSAGIGHLRNWGVCLALFKFISARMVRLRHRRPRSC